MTSGKSLFGLILFFLFLSTQIAVADETNFSKKLKKGFGSFGIQMGFGFTDDIPSGEDRADLSFLFVFPNYQYNLTGLIGDSWYQGTLNWHIEMGYASIVNRDEEFLIGLSPLMMQYKFINPKRKWAPNILLGGGFSYANFNDIAKRELGGEFQFLLHAGAGLEIFKDKWSYSINYRLLHISNAGIDDPNVGLNAHVVSLGFQF